VRREKVEAASVEALVQRAYEVGLEATFSEIADRETALEFAALIIKRQLPTDLSARQFLKTAGVLSRGERNRTLRAVPGLDPDRRLADLPTATRSALAATLRVVARR
jgi:hypothetical protein